jgi:hypothetical protein
MRILSYPKRCRGPLATTVSVWKTERARALSRRGRSDYGASCPLRLRAVCGVHRASRPDRHGRLWVDLTASPSRWRMTGVCASQPSIAPSSKPLAQTRGRVLNLTIPKRPRDMRLASIGPVSPKSSRSAIPASNATRGRRGASGARAELQAFQPKPPSTPTHLVLSR